MTTREDFQDGRGGYGGTGGGGGDGFGGNYDGNFNGDGGVKYGDGYSKKPPPGLYLDGDAQ